MHSTCPASVSATGRSPQTSGSQLGAPVSHSPASQAGDLAAGIGWGETSRLAIGVLRMVSAVTSACSDWRMGWMASQIRLIFSKMSSGRTDGGGTLAGGKVAGCVLTALGFFCSGGTGHPPRPLWYPVISCTSSGDVSTTTGTSGATGGAGTRASGSSADWHLAELLSVGLPTFRCFFTGAAGVSDRLLLSEESDDAKLWGTP